VPKFELYKHNDELFNIYYGIFYEPLFSIFSLAAILVGNRDNRTHFWKGAIQGSFHKRLVAIGPVVSEEDSWVVLFQNCVRHFRTPTKMAATAELNLT
jgi:hypothetical protein